jgi:hypothetical protein
MLDFNWGVFWAVLAALAVAKAFQLFLRAKFDLHI